MCQVPRWPRPRLTLTGCSFLIHPVATLTGRAGKGALCVVAEASGARSPAGAFIYICSGHGSS